MDEYLQILDLEQTGEQGAVTSIFVGGGTPSCLSSVQITRLFGIVRRRFCIPDGAEISFEMNPESVDAPKAAALRAAGVNRISLGVQSLDNDTLSRLGRPHRARETILAFQELRAAGFSNISVDVMFGLPWRTPGEERRDVERVLALGSEHVSLYALDVEERSLFFVNGMKADEDAQAALYNDVVRRAKTAGHEQYEISNFARPGFESRHNINYWEGGEYTGLGMAAHSHRNGERYWNAASLPLYLEAVKRQGNARCGGERLTPAGRLVETFLFSLRMNRGADLGGLEARFGVELSPDRREKLENFIKTGLLEEKDRFIRATERGRLVLDEISASIV